jgi:hypothetical protein
MKKLSIHFSLFFLTKTWAQPGLGIASNRFIPVILSGAAADTKPRNHPAMVSAKMCPIRRWGWTNRNKSWPLTSKKVSG